ncbi:hypothetical protein HMPREF9370_2051 [Neisseria wadsworthii 9715]|uniref:Uncharacterized protein n=1 Tax=Neisseria wadsworthii 9715 TaxID=1030841 RepID=G4CSJ1_9NEIS|nr:hypothetical protein HMPREF9370_2051 [Neisseria wadsworthii 9715]
MGITSSGADCLASPQAFNNRTQIGIIKNEYFIFEPYVQDLLVPPIRF